MGAINPIKLEFGAGLWMQGTDLQCPPGKFADGNLIRMGEGYRRPIKGWATGLSGTLTGNPRAAHAWKDNSRQSFAAFATHSKIYAHNGSVLDDITPSGYAAGDANTSDITFGNFGELLIICSDNTQSIYEFQPGGGGDAVVITNSPDALAIVVTPERFIVALGADGNPRKVAWCDQEARTTWTSTATNQAGDLELETTGVLMCGAKVNGGTLLWTSVDIHFMRYIGPNDVYSIKPAGNQCGIVGRHAYTTVDQTAYWMGLNGFWMWMGYAEQIPCEISDEVFTNINETHRHKSWGWHNAPNSEVWFFYPSGAATECSHAAIYNYKDRTWNRATLARPCGFEAGIFSWPVLVTTAGAMLKHETGYVYDVGTVRFLKSGLFEINAGGSLLMVDELLPDESTQGACEVYFYFREYANSAETMIGPYSAADRIPVEIAARYVRIEIRAAAGTGDFRIGTYSAVVKEWSAY